MKYGTLGIWCVCGPWFSSLITSTTKDKQKEADQWRVPRRVKGSKSTYYAHEALMGKWPWYGTSAGHDSSKELDLEWISPVVVELQCPQKGALIMPMVTPIIPPWAKDRDIAHLQTRTVPINLIWSKSALWLQSSGVRKIPGAFITSTGTPTICPHGQMTMTLQIYKPRQFKWTWFGVNRPCGCGVPASIRFQEPLSGPWACSLSPHGQMTMMLHIYGPRQSQWTWFGVNRSPGCWVAAFTWL